MAAMRRPLCGMIGVTLFGLIFTPIFYLIVRGLADPRKPKDSVVA